MKIEDGFQLAPIFYCKYHHVSPIPFTCWLPLNARAR